MAKERKLALITGASSGIGLELARVFAKEDYDLIIVSAKDRIKEAAKLLNHYEVNVHPIVADLATEEGVENLWAEIKSKYLPLDVAVLNAGVGVGGEFIKTDFKEELNLMNLNMVYLVCLTKKILREMVTQNQGKIMLTSSIAAEMPGPYYSVYAASKAFIQSFTEAIRYEMKDTGKNVIITSLQPGATVTEFFERADMVNTKTGKGKKDDPAQVAQDGYTALMKGKDHIVAGSIKHKIQAAVSKVMSEEAKAAAQGRSTRPDTF